MGSIFQVFVISLSWFMVSQLNPKKADELFKANKSFSAKVAGVPHGDLITISWNNEFISIRLAEIDSPDPRQPFSRQARQFTESLALNQTIKVTVNFVDQFQRVVGLVTLSDGRILNHEVVRWGYAWHYKVASKPNPILEQLEYRAWKKRLGFWIEKSPTPPWKFRADATSPSPPASPTKVDYDRIFEYGLTGNKSTQIYAWPACQGYRLPQKTDRIIFSSKLEAESLGYRSKKTCPK